MDSSPGAPGAPQRAWRAACSFCGAPVEFRSSVSPMAVCSYCRSTLVRDGETLRRIGESATLFDDHSPLAIGMGGRYQGAAFTLIGRIQLAYRTDEGDEGRWTEWHVLFDNGRTATFSEDNGRHVMSFPVRSVSAVPVDALRRQPLGETITVDGRPWVLSSRVKVRLHAAEGELSRAPSARGSWWVVELRNTADEVLSVEPDADPPVLDLGRSVDPRELALTGLPDGKQPAEAAVQGQGRECPSCGAGLHPTLESTKSLVCGHCHAVVDISQGLGADLRFFKQQNGSEPLIPIGTAGRLRVGKTVDDWQVVGYQERHDEPTDPDEERTFWREYLLYNREQGFAFLVDAEDGWSVVRTVTGVPALRQKITYRGVAYNKLYTYTACTTYVLGEFYWPVRRNQRTLNSDFVGTGTSHNLLLNREKTGNEITWSAGETVSADEVASAFRIPPGQRRAFRRTPKMVSSIDWGPWPTRILVTVVLLFFLIPFTLTRCSDDCDETRRLFGEASPEYQACRANARSGSSGGYGSSYGGYSSGGSHK